MEKYFEILKKCALFEGICESDLSKLLSCLGVRPSDFKKNETVIREGDRAKYIGIVLGGSVQIESTDHLGNRSIVGSVAAGELFGETLTCAGLEWMPVFVLAKEDSAILLIEASRISAPCSASCSFHSSMIYNLMKILARKNLNFHRKLEVLSKRTTEEKLMAYLDIEAKRQHSQSFTIPFDRQGLADYLGVDRSGLSAVIGRLTRDGVIRCHKNSFTLL